MASAREKPAFVTFTGIDDAALVKGMRELGRRYPVEWGVLIDPHRKGSPLFPDARVVDAFRRCGVRLCAHICGELARRIAAGTSPSLNLAGFSRIQINHGRSGASHVVVRAVSRYAARHGVRGVLQCNGPFPSASLGVDWLYDVSFGEGVQPANYPPIRNDSPFCGVSGGIGPDTVGPLLRNRLDVADGVAYWIDMESGVRTQGAFDLEKCEAVCRTVYDQVGRFGHGPALDN